MSSPVFRRETCRLCDGRDLELVMPVIPTPPGDAYIPTHRRHEIQAVYPMDLYLCGDCGAVQLLDVVDPVILYRDYLYHTQISLGLADHFRSYVDDVMGSLNPPEGGWALDIGSNDGSLLRAFQAKGMRVLGVDPASAIAHAATESGIETLPVFFTASLARQVKHERGTAALVTTNNVLANIDNLTDFIEGIRELLAPDGVWVFETGYLLDLVQNFLFDNIYHEHLCYFSVTPLKTFFRRHGMELIDVERVSSKGGSIRGFVQHAGGPRRVSSSVEALMALEAKTELHRPEPFRALTNRVEHTKDKLRHFFYEQQKSQSLIVGYGASVGVTTLLYEFGLGEQLHCLIDDNPQRHHLLSPGYHLVVLPPQTLYDLKPVYVLILAWRFAGTILKKHQAYVDQGGHFIIPLPNMEIWPSVKLPG